MYNNNMYNNINNRNNKGKNNKNVFIIGGIVLAIIIIGVVLFIFLKNKDTENKVFGLYDCKSYSSGAESSTYTVSLYLNEDKTFLYGPYDGIDNNYYKGTYTYKKENKLSMQTSGNKSYEFYTVSFKGTEKSVDGRLADSNSFTSEMEFAITKVNDKKEGIIIFSTTLNTYYCYEK